MGGGHSTENMEAATCMDAFLSDWVARFGMPATVTTDRGAQFNLALWSSMCTRLGVQHILTTAYHLQSNGMVEPVYRQIKAALPARAAGPALVSQLPWVLMGLWAASKEDSNVSLLSYCWGSLLSFRASFWVRQILHVLPWLLLQCDWLPMQRLSTRRLLIWRMQRLCMYGWVVCSSRLRPLMLAHTN